MSKSTFKTVFLALALCFSISSLAQATPVTMGLKYSGASFGNGASATGTISFDSANLSMGSVTSLSLIITGASAGNGVFTLADFGSMFWSVAGGNTLDYTRNLVGQPTAGTPWGTPGGSSGDFNFFANHNGAPNGTNYFTLTTNFGGSGDQLLLTEMAPSAVPEPSTFLLLAAGLGGLGLLRRKSRKA